MNHFKNIPGFVIFLAFVFAWPIGFVLLILKYTSKSSDTYEKVGRSAKIINENASNFNKLNKKKSKKRTLKIVTIILLVITLIFFATLISDIATGNFENIEGGIIVNVLSFGIFIPICINYLKTDKLIKKIESYQNLILIRDIYDTQKLSTYLNEPKEKILDFIVYMIREGYLELDIENDNIVKPKEYVDPASVFSIVCECCGASNKYIKGKNNKCEYCGNVLKL